MSLYVNCVIVVYILTAAIKLAEEIARCLNEFRALAEANRAPKHKKRGHKSKK